MEKKNLEKLYGVSTINLEKSLKSYYESKNLSFSHIGAISLSFVLKEIQENSLEVDTLDDFNKVSNLEPHLKDMLNNYINNHWEFVSEHIHIFSEEELISYILFSEDEDKYYGVATPKSLSVLASKLLDINSSEQVLELCSGKGSFFVEVFKDSPNIKYTGIELNYLAIDVAFLRAKTLCIDAKFKICNALEYSNTHKFDKLFSNYPFQLKANSLSLEKELISEQLNIPLEVINTASSDWLFNIRLVENMKDTGKAVAIMTEGSLWNNLDKNIRKYFLDKGYVEAVISLPGRLFNYTTVATSMIVFSKNNDNVRMIDARELSLEEGKRKFLSKDNIDKIIELMSKETEISVRVDRDQMVQNDCAMHPIRYTQKLPNFLNSVEFGSIVKKITRGTQIKREELDKIKSNEITDFQYFESSNFESGVIGFKEGYKYLSEIPDKLQKYCINNDSIVISKLGIPMFKTAIANIEDKRKLLANGNVFVIEIDSLKANPYYIQAFLSSELGQKSLYAIHSGAVIPTLSVEKIMKMQIPLMSMEDQNKIATEYKVLMDDIALLKRKIERAEEKLKQIIGKEDFLC